MRHRGPRAERFGLWLEFGRNELAETPTLHLPSFGRREQLGERRVAIEDAAVVVDQRDSTWRLGIDALELGLASPQQLSLVFQFRIQRDDAAIRLFDLLLQRVKFDLALRQLAPQAAQFLHKAVGLDVGVVAHVRQLQRGQPRLCGSASEAIASHMKPNNSRAS